MSVRPNFAPADGVTAHGYYLVTYHVTAATLPPGCVYLEAWGSRPFVDEINGPCFGAAEFDHPLTAKQQIVYGLLPYSKNIKGGQKS